MPVVLLLLSGCVVKHLEGDFGAIITPGLDLAFRDRVTVRLSGRTITGEQSTRDICVCGPGAFIILKALAFGMRGLPKDAYDMLYVARNYESGPAEIARRLASLLDSPDARRAIPIHWRESPGFRGFSGGGTAGHPPFNEVHSISRGETMPYIERPLSGDVLVHDLRSEREGRLRIELESSWIELWKGEASSSNSNPGAG